MNQDKQLMTTYSPEKSLFITEYDPKYCKMILDYAYIHMNIEGFFAQQMIPEEVSDKWEEEYPEWHLCIKMAPMKIKQSLNEGFEALKKIASGELVSTNKLDTEMMQKLLFRALDSHIKEEKETGSFKRKGIQQGKNAKKTNSQSLLSDQVRQIVEALSTTLGDDE